MMNKNTNFKQNGNFSRLFARLQSVFVRICDSCRGQCWSNYNGNIYVNIGINCALRPAEKDSPMISIPNLTPYEKCHAVRNIPSRRKKTTYAHEEIEVKRSLFYKNNQNVQNEFLCLHSILR